MMFNYHCHVLRESCWLQSIEYILEERKNCDLEPRIFCGIFHQITLSILLLISYFSREQMTVISVMVWVSKSSINNEKYIWIIYPKSFLVSTPVAAHWLNKIVKVQYNNGDELSSPMCLYGRARKCCWLMYLVFILRCWDHVYFINTK